ncbi:MAG: hypothetical protein HAW67_03815 [Endozoicomonadaceae bacterium]|nr:hypothetical protein [Endozoicomonadaceae bacterium]
MKDETVFDIVKGRINMCGDLEYHTYKPDEKGKHPFDPQKYIAVVTDTMCVSAENDKRYRNSVRVRFTERTRNTYNVITIIQKTLETRKQINDFFTDVEREFGITENKSDIKYG